MRQRAHPGGRRRRQARCARGSCVRRRDRGRHAVPLTIDERRPGWAELDPEALVAGALGAPRPACCAGAAIGTGRWRCACARLTRTQVLLDSQRRALGPAILFRDRRAFAVARDMNGMTAFDAPARLAWIERHQPARFAQDRRTWSSPRTISNFRLTGSIAGRARRAVATSGRGAAVVSLARLAGVPVFAGAMDTWASAVGAGAVRPGQAYDVAGTSEAVGLVTHGATDRGTGPRSLHVDGIRASDRRADAGRRRIARAGAMRAFRVRGALGTPIARVGAARCAKTAPVFLPYLAGERAPVWYSDVRGAFHGVGRAMRCRRLPVERAGRRGAWPCATSSTTRKRAAGQRAHELRVSRRRARGRMRGAAMKADVRASR